MIYTEEERPRRPLDILAPLSGGGAGVRPHPMNDSLLAGVTSPRSTKCGSTVRQITRPFLHRQTTENPFTPTRKYPVIFLIHGGPQGAWGESWDLPLNAQSVLRWLCCRGQPIPRFTWFYGQKFIDEIK